MDAAAWSSAEDWEGEAAKETRMEKPVMTTESSCTSYCGEKEKPDLSIQKTSG